MKIARAATAGLVAVVLAGCGAVTGYKIRTAPPPAAHVSSASRPDAIHGRYLGYSVPGFPPDPANLLSLQHGTETQPDLISTYTTVGASFDAEAAWAITSLGALPVIQLDPDRVPLATIASGREDGWLRSYAQSVAAFGQPVVIGFAHEFNGPWWPWSFEHETPKVFVAAWRHIVTVFRQEGASNVIWMWTVNVSGPSTTALAPWWPGSHYVNWVGLDGYFYLPTETFSNVFDPTIGQVQKFTRAPVLINETGANPASGRVRAITNLFKSVASTPEVIGLIWFDYDKFKNHDWRIDDDPAALAAFRRGAVAYLKGNR